MVPMEGTRYELVEPVGRFDVGELMEVRARFGEWHIYDVRLEPADERRIGSVELTAERLDAVARPAGSERRTLFAGR